MSDANETKAQTQIHTPAKAKPEAETTSSGGVHLEGAGNRDLLVEIAEVTPPLGFNLFIMQTMTGKEQTEVAWASLPFFLMLVVTVVLVTAFPVTLVTGLPDWLLAR